MKWKTVMKRKLVKTDLAYESYSTDDEKNPTNGIKTSVIGIDAGEIIKTEILNSKGEALTGRKMGTYLTIPQGYVYKYTKNEQKRASKVISRALFEVYKWEKQPKALVVGLGNREITSDALGDYVLKELTPTLHLKNDSPALFNSLGYELGVLFCPTVSQGGILASDTVKGLLKIMDFDLVIAIDSLLTSSTERLLSTVQISNTGILPGSASGKARGEISFETMGVPVICLGVPTVISAEALNINFDGEFFTLSNIDIQMNDLARVIADGITDFLTISRE